MKTENKTGEITFENLIQLRAILEQAWTRGKLEQAVTDLKRERKTAKKLAKQLGIKFDHKAETPKAETFQEWFLSVVKKMQIL